MAKRVKKVAARKKAKKTKTAKRRIEVRMYNVGFGDCFLLRIPTSSGERRMLVDCGYHSQGKGQFSDRDLVQQIQSDLDGEGLDVVVATHRHQDHISGFGEADLWKSISVEEVWLPFTANPRAAHDDPALAAWEQLLSMTSHWVDATGKLHAAAEIALAARKPEEKEAAAFMLWNARANAPAIDNLLRGMRRADGRTAKRRFLPESGNDVPWRLTTAVLPGVTTHVLGPSRDPAFRKKRKVPSSWGLTDGASPTAVIDSPFGLEWRIRAERLPQRKPFKESALEIIRLFNDDLLAVASAVDGFLNGESLVLVLEVGKARLMLTGDAEVASWTKILDDNEAAAIAATATFFKIGHHGSHNATPLRFLKEHLQEGTPAMMSTQQGPGRYRNGIPLARLLDTLRECSLPLARSDRPMKKRQGVFAPGPQKRWIDCAIPC